MLEQLKQYLLILVAQFIWIEIGMRFLMLVKFHFHFLIFNCRLLPA